MKNESPIIRGTNDKPVASRCLAELCAGAAWFDGQLIFGYPVVQTPEGKHSIDAIWISPEKGIVVFDLVEGSDAGDYASRQDDAANRIEARLKTHRKLMVRRDLQIPIHTISFAPAIANVAKSRIPEYSLDNRETLARTIMQLAWTGSSKTVFDAALSAIQSISTIRLARTKRVITRQDSRGAKLKQLEDSIATLDTIQGKAVLETVNGVQRIRGLAGSGKTIVLALKAAYLHAQHPDWRIAVTFNTRSLKGQFRRLINSFHLEQTGEEPDWQNLRIISAWGAPGGDERDGMYHEFCQVHGIEYLDYRAARVRFRDEDAFAGACGQALSEPGERKTRYHAILVDEAQDFSPAFLRLCYEFLEAPKRLVYAYDELQNLSGHSVQSPEEIFGVQPDGSPTVTLANGDPAEPRRDIILSTCYRNSRPVLVTAHALGFGVYRESPGTDLTGLVQMFDHSSLWEEIGYQVKSGALRDGASVTLGRTTESSPLFLESHSGIDDLIQFVEFEDEDAQARWLVNEISTNLDRDELRHDDIVVINPDPLTTRMKVGPIRARLLEAGISSHLAGVDTDPDIFFQPENQSVTFTGIYRAKGNEAGMVYVINAQDCHSSAHNLARLRNRLFTAITRSKAWVRVLGVGSGMAQLRREYERLKDRNFELSFVYPTREQRDILQIVHRDMTRDEQERLFTRSRSLNELVNDLESGAILPEDLDKDLWHRLGQFYDRAKGW